MKNFLIQEMRKLKTKKKDSIVKTNLLNIYLKNINHERLLLHFISNKILIKPNNFNNFIKFFK